MICLSAFDVGGCGFSGVGGSVDCVTCGAFGIPDTLSITDALGTYTATWTSSLSLWVTPQLCSAP